MQNLLHVDYEKTRLMTSVIFRGDYLLAEIGAGRVMEMENSITWGTTASEPALSLTQPFDGKAATVGNGTMIALKAESPEQIETLYQKAIELGASDEGKPGFRMEGFYSCYFRDPDGNKLSFYHTV